jgi:hypothetical protein
MEAGLAFEAAVTEKVIINGAVGGGEAQTRCECVLELLADEFGVGLFGFHDRIRDGMRRETELKLTADS